MRKEIIFGIGILIILLALAGTGSARTVFSASCNCHTSIPALNVNGSFFNDTHKFNGNSVPIVANSCKTCHLDPLSADYNLNTTGQNYSDIHRYNATTLASEKLIGTTGCYNCHVNASYNDFTLLNGTPSYLTSSVCEACHKAKYDNWTNTLHRVMLTDNTTAQAMDLPLPANNSWENISYVIVTKFQLDYINKTGYFLSVNDSYNTENQTFETNSSGHAGARYGTCASCHTTGYNATGLGGLAGINGTFNEAGIGCERCHKPAGNGHQVVVNYSGDLCRECHTGGRHGTGWENGEHAPPPYEIGSSCMFCHSSFDQYKNQNVTEENATGVSCGVCHNTHDITDNKYAETFSNSTFNETTWSVVADSKLSFFNATASIAAGTDVFDDLSNRLLYANDSNRKDPSYGITPINLTGRPVSEVLCSMCHYRHGIAHIPGVNLTHGAEGERATCTDCHMGGANATVGKDMMKNHANDPLIANSCGGTNNPGNCHSSMPPLINEWSESLHNGKEVGSFAFNQTTGVGKSRENSCDKCHSPMDWNPAKDTNNTKVLITNESFNGVTCSVCHNLHDMGAWLNETNTTFGAEKPYAVYEKYLSGTRYKGKYTMVENTTELCGNCHASVRIGSSEPGWPIGAANPNKTHGFPAKDIFVGSWKQTGMLKFECTSCHFAPMTRDANGTSLPVDQKVKGHSFQVNTTILMNGTACSSCHITGSALGNLSTSIENVQIEIQDNYDLANVKVTDTLNSIKNQSGETGLSRTKIAQAYWNIQLVYSDKSLGVHDPAGTNKLLDDAVVLANAANASLGEAATTASSVDLVTGWNLVALNGTASDPAPVSVLLSVHDNVTVVWGYNATARTWELYDPVMAPTSLNSLKSIVPGKGYWILAKQDCEWTV